MVEIFYIPGLNNYGDDRVHIGPLKFFRMHERLAQELARHGVKIVPIYPEKSDLNSKIQKLGEKIKSDATSLAIILGHSTGGIMARSLLNSPGIKKNIAGVITFGCPHYGSHLADVAYKLTSNRSVKLKFLKFFGYDAAKNLKYILDLSSENLKKHFGNENHAEVPVYSLICTKRSGQLPLAFKMLHSYSGENLAFATDGIVSEESQRWGKTLGPFDLDHLAQIGFFKHLVNPFHKRQTIEEFDRLVKTIANTVKEIRQQ